MEVGLLAFSVVTARAKQFATTTEVMFANWVQRHAAFLSQNPAWRTYKYRRTYKCAGKKKKKRNVADEETTRKLIAALEEESIKYETYFKLIIATGMRRGECCKDRTSFDVWWFWQCLSAKIEVLHTSKPNSGSCCETATTPPYSAATW